MKLEEGALKLQFRDWILVMTTVVTATLAIAGIQTQVKIDLDNKISELNSNWNEKFSNLPPEHTKKQLEALEKRDQVIIDKLYQLSENQVKLTTIIERLENLMQ